MAEKSFDVSIFPDLTTPEVSARLLAGLYGAGAADAASSAVATALADNRYKDYRFWTAVRAAVAPVFPASPPASDTAETADDEYSALLNLPSVDELLRMIRQFTRIADRDTRDFAIDQVKAIADRHVVPSRGRRS